MSADSNWLLSVDSVSADPNWLLSSLAQSTAALVAIVGGLLVSRYVALHAEQEAAGRRVADLSRRLHEAEVRHEVASVSMSEHLVDRVIRTDSVYACIAEADFQPSLEQVIVGADGAHEEFDLGLVVQRVTVVAEELKRALRELTRDLPEVAEPPSWNRYRRGSSYDMKVRDAWRWAYANVAAQKQAQAQHMAKAFGLSAAHESERPVKQDVAPRGPDIVFTPTELDFLRHGVEDAATEVRQLQQERRLAGEAYDAARQPEGFALALEVFTTFAIVGLAVPLSIMAGGVTKVSLWLRIMLVVVFLAGVGLLLRFLFVYARKLRAASGAEHSLPEHIWGLFR